jgi:hypothetical protein
MPTFTKSCSIRAGDGTASGCWALQGIAEQSNPEIEHREAKRFFLQCHELVENLTPAVGSCHAGWACKDYC